MEKRYLQPGDKVRLTKEVADQELAGCFSYPIIIGTQGSIGTVLSFDEFRAEQNSRYWQPHVYEGFLSTVKTYVEQSQYYPIKFDKVMPSYEGTWDCRMGDINRISASALEKLYYVDQDTFFTVEPVGFFDEDQHRAAKPGHKFLPVDFTMESGGEHGLQFLQLPTLWLGYATSPAGNSITEAPAPAARAEWADSDVNGKARIAGHAVFQIPDQNGIYRFILEILSLGRWEVAIKYLRLQPGDRVRQINLIGRPSQVGEVASFDEYCAFFRQQERGWSENYFRERFERERTMIKTCFEYPVRFGEKIELTLAAVLEKVE